MKRYTVAPSTLIEVEDGDYVLHSDYAILESKFKIACAQNKALLEQRNSILARHNALVEAVAWERECQNFTYRKPLSIDAMKELLLTRYAARAAVDRLIAEGEG